MLDEEKLRKMKKAKAKIFKQTKGKMEIIGTYRSEFDATIQRYSELSHSYTILNEKWYENDCKITEEYTNKAGFTNVRKTALYMSLENVRKELTDLENLFGLTPKGLKAIKKKGLDKGKNSKLAEALNDLSKKH